MVHIYRLTLALLLASFASFASAYPASGQYSASLSRLGITATGGSAASACSGLGSSIILRGCASTGNVSPIGTFQAPSTCALQTDGAAVAANCNWADTGVVSSAGPYSCGPDSTLSGSECVCASGFTDTGSSCSKVVSNQSNCSDAAVAGSAAFGQQPIFTRLSSGTTLCIANEANSPGVGCTVELLDPAVVTLGGGQRYVRGYPRRTNTGSDTCPISPASDPSPKTEQEVVDAPKACPGGQQASMNGVVVCQPFPAGSTVTTPTKTTTTTNTVTGVDGNSPTSSSASGQTQCVANQCTTTTTTTTTKADGTTSTSTSSTTQSKGGFCAENPASPQCENSSFGGSCSAGFTCDGDAVMCAIARDQHSRNCALFDTETAQSSLFQTEKNKTGSQVINEDRSISSSSFDTSDALGGGGACIADKSITVMGWTGSLPFSGVCAHLAILGNVLLAVSFLLAGRIVVRG